MTAIVIAYSKQVIVSPKAVIYLVIGTKNVEWDMFSTILELNGDIQKGQNQIHLKY